MTHFERSIGAAVEQIEEPIVAVQTRSTSSLHPRHAASVVNGEHGGYDLVGSEPEIESASYIEVDIFHKGESKVSALCNFHERLPRPGREDDEGGTAVFESGLKLSQPDELPLAHRTPCCLQGDEDELVPLRQLSEVDGAPVNVLQHRRQGGRVLQLTLVLGIARKWCERKGGEESECDGTDCFSHMIRL